MGYLDSYYVSDGVKGPFVKIVGGRDELKRVIEGQGLLRWIKITKPMSEEAIKSIINDVYPGSSVKFDITYPVSHIQGVILELEHKHEYEEFLTREEIDEMNNTFSVDEVEYSSYGNDLSRSMKIVIDKYLDSNRPENIKVLDHSSLLVELSEIYIDRNRKYGDSFSQNFAEFGMIYPVSRIGEKYNRLKGIVKDGEVSEYPDESLEDTLLDIANYSILTAMDIRSRKKGK